MSKTSGMLSEPQFRTAEATPHAASLIESLRNIGYSLETALADIVDNSITAKARNVDIFAETSTDEPYIVVVDDGLGMTEAQLIDAMRLGSRDPLQHREKHDLGRFGLGLKSASFSQCRRLSVVSRKGGVLCGAVWDLDRVARTKEWRITMLDDFSNVPFICNLPSGQGTLVLWENMDRLSGGYAHDTVKRAEHMNSRIAGAERHLRLVFHRFMEEDRPPLKIALNHRVLKPFDPFASAHPACQKDQQEELRLSGGIVRIKSFTLPHHKAMTSGEWEALGGPRGHIGSQGFYVYRERRLIISGSWLGLAKQTELTKLCRIRVDIPNTMDPIWKIDVKKASAQLPGPVRERLKTVIERFTSTSKRTYQKRGRKLVDDNPIPVWLRIRQDGSIIYRPNPDHPVFTGFSKQLPEKLHVSFRNCFSLLASSLPIEALHADIAGSAEEVRADTPNVEVLQETLEAIIPHLLRQGFSREKLLLLLHGMEPFCSAKEETSRIVKELIHDGGEPNE